MLDNADKVGGGTFVLCIKLFICLLLLYSPFCYVGSPNNDLPEGLQA